MELEISQPLSSLTKKSAAAKLTQKEVEGPKPKNGSAMLAQATSFDGSINTKVG